MINGNRAVWRSFRGLLLLLGVMMGSGYALADDSSEGFSATVKVDATADSAATARELARIDGQRRALMTVIDRLGGSPDSAKLSKLDDKAITDMVENFEVANERMSAVHYLADYTFHFRPSKVRRLVHVADSAPTEANSKPGAAEGGGKPTAAESGGKPLIVLPVYKDAGSTVLWEDPNAWREAWAQRAAGSEGVRLIVPLGDASDLATIDAGRAEAGKSDALATMAQRNGGDEAVVALAIARHAGDDLVGLDVNIKRYRSGHLVDTHSTTLGANPGENADIFLQRAAASVAGEIANGATKSSAPRSDQQASLSASVPIGSIGDWVRIRDRLASVPAIRKVDLLSLNRHEAKIQIKYLGGPDQLRSGLAGVDLGLDGADPEWRLQLSGVAGTR